jgi:hypothetical protein
VYLCYNRFISTMKQEPVVEQLLPLSQKRWKGSQGQWPAGWDYIYEPDAQTVIDESAGALCRGLVYQAVAENMASEHAARMVAMKAATDNAGNVIAELKLVYNKTRQAAITKELSEIVAGCCRSGLNEFIFGANVMAQANVNAGVQGKDCSVYRRRGGRGVPTRPDAKIYDALKMDGSALTLEVQQQLGDGIVRTIALGSSDGLRRGMMVNNTAEPITVPVGKATLGRIMDVLGNPIDERGPVARIDGCPSTARPRL